MNVQKGQMADVQKLISELTSKITAQIEASERNITASLSTSQERQVNLIVWRTLAVVALALFASIGGIGKFYIDSRTDPSRLKSLEQQGEKIVDDLRKLPTQAAPPLVGMITDFGNGAYYLGKFRGAIYTSVPNARLIDISHEIRGWDVSEASWTLYNAAKTFPPESVFLGIVNPGADLRNSYLVITKSPRFYFIGAGYGLFDHVVAHFGLQESYLVPANSDDDTFGIETFIPLVKSILLHSSIQDLKDRNLIAKTPYKYSLSLPAAIGSASYNNSHASGFICAIDRWGNLQTNIPPDAFRLNAIYTVKIGAKIVDDFVFAKSYQDGEGKKGVLIAQDGWVQIAVNRGHANELFKVDRAEVSVVIDKATPN